MYCMRRSAFRKYTLAAWNGTADVTVPETLARPDSSDLPGADCAAASRADGNRPNAIASSTASTASAGANAFFMTGSFSLTVNSCCGSSDRQREECRTYPDGMQA